MPVFNSITSDLQKDAPIVILDEAMARVDADKESYIQDAISDRVKGKTLLVIAHRLNTIQALDQILAISDGRIRQRGIYEELILETGMGEEQNFEYCNFGNYPLLMI